MSRIVNSLLKNHGYQISIELDKNRIHSNIKTQTDLKRIAEKAYDHRNDEINHLDQPDHHHWGKTNKTEKGPSNRNDRSESHTDHHHDCCKVTHCFACKVTPANIDAKKPTPQ